MEIYLFIFVWANLYGLWVFRYEQFKQEGMLLEVVYSCKFVWTGIQF